MKNSSHQIQINRIIRVSNVEGFGKRYCIWVQGCSIRCQGCENTSMWSSDKGYRTSVKNLLSDIKQTQTIEGVTLLGGEPLNQKEAIAQLVTEVQRQGLSVILFTGYQYKELINRKDDSIQQILKHVDLLIDGPFIESRLSYERPWIGSDNQKYWFLTNRYSMHNFDKEKQISKYEVRILADGKIAVNGMGSLHILKDLAIWEGK